MPVCILRERGHRWTSELDALEVRAAHGEGLCKPVSVLPLAHLATQDHVAASSKPDHSRITIETNFFNPTYSLHTHCNCLDTTATTSFMMTHHSQRSFCAEGLPPVCTRATFLAVCLAPGGVPSAPGNLNTVVWQTTQAAEGHSHTSSD